MIILTIIIIAGGGCVAPAVENHNSNKNDKSNERIGTELNGNRPIKCAQETCVGTFKTETELNKHISRCHSDNFTIE